MYEEGDSDKLPGQLAGSSKSINNSFMRGLKEAAELYEAYTMEKKAREAANADKVIMIIRE